MGIRRERSRAFARSRARWLRLVMLIALALSCVTADESEEQVASSRQAVSLCRIVHLEASVEYKPKRWDDADEEVMPPAALTIPEALPVTRATPGTSGPS
jgi:hypothetical protein